MKLIEQEYKIINSLEDYKTYLHSCAQGCVLCYNKQLDDIENIEKYIRQRIHMGHESIIEHATLSILFTIDRGLSHELVRHRLCSFTQMSTRFCDSKEGIECIRPHWLYKDKNKVLSNLNRQKMIELAKDDVLTDAEYTYLATLVDIEESYKLLRESGLPPEDARGVLPNSLATKILVTANMREWRHILRLRAVGTTGRPHPDMKRLMSSLLKDLKEAYPVFFEDIDENN